MIENVWLHSLKGQQGDLRCLNTNAGSNDSLLSRGVSKRHASPNQDLHCGTTIQQNKHHSVVRGDLIQKGSAAGLVVDRRDAASNNGHKLGDKRSHFKWSYTSYSK
eukprot:1359823-Amphidinium_carterae.1